MVKGLSLLGIGIALIMCTTKVIGASNQSITAADIDQVETIAIRICADSAMARQSVEGQDWVRSIKFRIKAVRTDCVHVEAFRILANPFDIHFTACKHDGKWQIEPAHLEFRKDK